MNTLYLEKRLASALSMAERADGICARNSHLRLASLYRLRIAAVQVVSNGKAPQRLRTPPVPVGKPIPLGKIGGDPVIGMPFPAARLA